MNEESILNQLLQNVDAEDIVKRMVFEGLDKKISALISQEIVKYTEIKIRNIIDDEIDASLHSPMELRDGWHAPEKYESFEAYFKKVLYDKLQNNWDMINIIEKSVELKISQFYEEEGNKIRDAIIETLGKIK